MFQQKSSRQQRERLLASSPEPANASTTLENVNAAVDSSLDYLKEQLFRLELRRQAGTISDEEYAGARPRRKSSARPRARLKGEAHLRALREGPLLRGSR